MFEKGKGKLEFDKFIKYCPILNNVCLNMTLYFRSLSRARQLSGANPINADNYHYFSYDTCPRTCITGIAQTGAVRKEGPSGSICIQDKTYRVGISEWVWDKTNTAHVSISISIVIPLKLSITYIIIILSNLFHNSITFYNVL